MKRYIKNADTLLWLIVSVLTAVFCQSCRHLTEQIPADVAWTINNKFNQEFIIYTVYEDGLIPVEYVPSILGISPVNTIHVYCPSMDRTIYSKVRGDALTKIYFVMPFEDMDIRNITNNVGCNIASFILNAEWMAAHGWTINFPEDCTVNPDLWKIYDLDKFVELYGPLNAKGWDEVWQKWEESKLSGEEDSKLSS